MGWKIGRDRRWLLLFLVAALLLGASRWHVSGQSAGLIPPAHREPTPELTFAQLDGGDWKLSSHRGQVVVLNFWATWCGPCRDELPALLETMRQTPPGAVAMVGVSMDSGPDVRAQVQAFAAQYRLPWPIAFPDSMFRAMAESIGLPTTVLLDKRGRRAQTYVGEVDRATLAKDVAALLAESSD